MKHAPARCDKRSNKVKEKPIISCHLPTLVGNLAIPGHHNMTGWSFPWSENVAAWLPWLTLEPNEGAEATKSMYG